MKIHSLINTNYSPPLPMKRMKIIKGGVSIDGKDKKVSTIKRHFYRAENQAKR